MDGINFISGGVAGSFNPGPDWQIKGTGDFNGDGRSDILWQDADGTPAIWLMNGMHAVTVGAVGPFNPGPSWHVRAPATTTTMAGPTSSGSTTVARPRSGSWTA